MIYKEHGTKNKPIIVFIHGGCLSEWMWEKQIELFRDDYHIYTIILDGHGEDYKNTFISIEECAVKIIDFIKSKCYGKVFAICGFSIGAQITVEILSRENQISNKAVIESAMVIPMKWLGKISKPLYKVVYPIVRNKFFLRLAAKSINISGKLFERYYNELCNLKKNTFINMGVYNSKYSLPKTFEDNAAEVLALCGAREISNIKKSAKLIARCCKNSTLLIVENCGHGVSLLKPDRYINIVSNFLSKE